MATLIAFLINTTCTHLLGMAIGKGAAVAVVLVAPIVEETSTMGVLIMSGRREIVLPLFLIDFVTISIATDNSRPSAKPETWGIGALDMVAVSLGFFMVMESFGMLYIAMNYLGLTDATGLGKYGYKDELAILFTGIFEAAGFYAGYRLLELFGGFHRDEYGIPARYPVACSPQAWSAGSIPYMLAAALGFSSDALNKRLTLVKPSLPEWLERVTISSPHVGNATVKLEFERVGKSTLVRVVEKHGTLK